jgi:anaerobic ribonucleoside-triphosphate reductase activating protein
MNVATIKKRDIANGVGVRVSLFVSGCTHHCKGCFNREAWDFSYGTPYTEETENELLALLAPEYIDGLSLLGGEPFEPQNQRVLIGLLRRFKEAFPSKTVWCYTGYTLESDLLSESRARCEVTDEMLSHIDVLIDGEFVEELRNIRLLFRGSENQRLIDLKKTMDAGKVVLWER